MIGKVLKVGGALALGVVFLTGCSQNMAKFSAVSTGNVSFSKDTQKGEYVEGKDCIHLVFGIPFGNSNNRISGAVAKALEKAVKKEQPADALVNVDIRASYWNIIIYGRNCIIAKGQAIGIK